MLTPEQIELRKEGIGSSDIARILYFDKWEVWAEKTDKIVDKLYTPAMRRGDALEPVIMELYKERLELSDNNIYKGYTVRDGWKLATPDYFIAEDRLLEPEEQRILECKASSSYFVGWGNEWTDEVPKYTIAQVQWQMGICNTESYCHIGAFVANSFLIYRVDFDVRIFERLEEVGHAFWHDHVMKDTPPPADKTDSAAKWLHKLYPRNKGVLLNQTEATRETVDKLRDVKKRLDHLRKDKARSENQLKEIIGDADGIDGLCTWKANVNGDRRFRLLKEK